MPTPLDNVTKSGVALTIIVKIIFGNNNFQEIWSIAEISVCGWELWHLRPVNNMVANTDTTLCLVSGIWEPNKLQVSSRTLSA